DRLRGFTLLLELVLELLDRLVAACDAALERFRKLRLLSGLVRRLIGDPLRARKRVAQAVELVGALLQPALVVALRPLPLLKPACELRASALELDNAIGQQLSFAVLPRELPLGVPDDLLLAGERILVLLDTLLHLAPVRLAPVDIGLQIVHFGAKLSVRLLELSILGFAAIELGQGFAPTAAQPLDLAVDLLEPLCGLAAGRRLLLRRGGLAGRLVASLGGGTADAVDVLFLIRAHRRSPFGVNQSIRTAAGDSQARWALRSGRPPRRLCTVDTIAVRVLTPSFARMDFRYARTVSTLTARRFAISLSVDPDISASRTSTSRFDKRNSPLTWSRSMEASFGLLIGSTRAAYTSSASSSAFCSRN